MKQISTLFGRFKTLFILSLAIITTEYLRYLFDHDFHHIGAGLFVHLFFGFVALSVVVFALIRKGRFGIGILGVFLVCHVLGDIINLVRYAILSQSHGIEKVLSVGNADILSDVIAILISIPTLTIIVHILKDILRVEKQVRDMTTPQLLKDALETSFIYMENKGRTDKKSIEALERLYIGRQCVAEKLLKRDSRATDLLRMWDKANQAEKGAIYKELRNKYGEEPLLSLRAGWVIPPMKA